MSDKQKEYCYSWDDEVFDSGLFDSIDAAIADASKESDDGDDGLRTEVFVGEAVPFSNSHFFPDADWVIEHMQEQAYGESSDYSDGYAEVSAEARDELNSHLQALLNSWCEKHGVSPQFFRVRNSKLYKLPSAAD